MLNQRKKTLQRMKIEILLQMTDTVLMQWNFAIKDRSKYDD